MSRKTGAIHVALKFATTTQEHWAYQGLALDLGISTGALHASVKRLLKSGLLRKEANGIGPHPRNLEKFLLGGAEFVFPPEYTSLTRGVATSTSAAPLAEHFAQSSETNIVWPDPEGNLRGIGLKPIYPSAPFAAMNDPGLYELLALFDALRGGQLREGKIAQDHIRQILGRLSLSSIR